MPERIYPSEKITTLRVKLARIAWDEFSRPDGTNLDLIRQRFIKEVGKDNASFALHSGQLKNWIQDLREFGSIKPLEENQNRLVTAGPGENKYF